MWGLLRDRLRHGHELVVLRVAAPPTRMTGQVCLWLLGVAAIGSAVGHALGLPSAPLLFATAACFIVGAYLKDLPFRDGTPVDSNDWRSGCGWLLQVIGIWLLLALTRMWGIDDFLAPDWVRDP